MRRRLLSRKAGGSLFEATISSNQQEMNLAAWATGQGWDGTSPAEITIAAGVWVWSDSIATPALTTGNFPNGLTLIVEGFVAGKGGNGGSGTDTAENGGNAISLGCDVSIHIGSGGYIGGGGGGGVGRSGVGGGGGAGGGNGGNSEGGAGGAVGQAGSDGGSTGRSGDGGGAGGGGGAA